MWVSPVAETRGLWVRGVREERACAPSGYRFLNQSIERIVNPMMSPTANWRMPLYWLIQSMLMRFAFMLAPLLVKLYYAIHVAPCQMVARVRLSGLSGNSYSRFDGKHPSLYSYTYHLQERSEYVSDSFRIRLCPIHEAVC